MLFVSPFTMVSQYISNIFYWVEMVSFWLNIYWNILFRIGLMMNFSIGSGNGFLQKCWKVIDLTDEGQDL